jgi:DNA-binding response OmpR family regulator
MSTAKILLIDDDKLLRRSLAFNLQQAGFETHTAENAEVGLEIIRQHRPDLVVLDVGLPGMDGLEALRVIREQLGVPVILLTARRRGLDEVLGLELGADDYITKPFDFDVLLARIKLVLRRTISLRETLPELDVIHSGDLIIDTSAHRVTIRDQQINLSPREFEVLLLLASNAGKVLATNDILARVWGAEFDGQPQVVYVHIRWLREKLGDTAVAAQRIQTVRGVGYKYNPKEV